jgi:hypothetical protein
LSDRIFYVGSDNNGQFTGFIPAKCLERGGSYVMDPSPGGSQRAFLYSDNQGSNKTDGRIANPNNYLIVPANYSDRRAREFAGQIADMVGYTDPSDDMGTMGLHSALGRMTAAFLPFGTQDLQRHPQWGIPEGSMVPAFVGSASNHLGYVAALAGLPMNWAEIGGGAANLENAARQDIVSLWSRLITGTTPSRPVRIDTDGPFKLSKQNHFNIAQGYAAGLAAQRPPAPFDDYGYSAQRQSTGSQIGDGGGIAPLSATLASVNPDEPAPPTWPPEQNSQVRYLGSTLRY